MTEIKIEIKSTDVNRKSGNSKHTGKPYEFVEQEGWAHLPGEPYPVKCRFTLPDDVNNGGARPPYAPGSYTIDLSKCLNVGRFESLQLSNRLHLLPVGGR